MSIDDDLAAIWGDEAEWDGRLAEVVRPHIIDALRRGARLLGEQLGITPSLDVHNPEVVGWIERYTGLLANRVNDTIREHIRQALIEGVMAGDGPKELRDRIAQAFGCIRDPNGILQAGPDLMYRAEMIARTESARAETAGYREQARETGVTQVRWVAAPDACEFCAELDGRTVSIEESFFRRGEALTIETDDGERTLHLDYADVDGPPLHPWCRCTLAAEIGGD
jgi:hypothetical protein